MVAKLLNALKARILSRHGAVAGCIALLGLFSIPFQYSPPYELPAEAELVYSAGALSVHSYGGRRPSTFYRLTRSDGSVLTFDCARGGSRPCLNPWGPIAAKQLNGASALIGYPVDHPNRLATLTVNGKEYIGYEQSKHHYLETSSYAFAIWVLGVAVAVIVFGPWVTAARRRVVRRLANPQRTYVRTVKTCAFVLGVLVLFAWVASPGYKPTYRIPPEPSLAHVEGVFSLRKTGTRLSYVVTPTDGTPREFDCRRTHKAGCVSLQTLVDLQGEQVVLGYPADRPTWAVTLRKGHEVHLQYARSVKWYEENPDSPVGWVFILGLLFGIALLPRYAFE